MAPATTAAVVVTVSAIEFRLRAESTPDPTPTEASINIAQTARRRLAGRRSATMSRTGSRVWKLIPERVTVSLSRFQYCS